MKLQHTSYMENNLSGPLKLAEVIRKTTAALRPYASLFDAIAFQGMSGALVAPAVSIRLKKHLIMVRKDDGHHGQHTVEGALDCPYVILDDLSSTGQTLKRIQNLIFKESPDSFCAGIYLYQDGYFKQEPVLERSLLPTKWQPQVSAPEAPLQWRQSIYSYPQALCP